MVGSVKYRVVRLDGKFIVVGGYGKDDPRRLPFVSRKVEFELYSCVFRRWGIPEIVNKNFTFWTRNLHRGFHLASVPPLLVELREKTVSGEGLWTLDFRSNKTVVGRGAERQLVEGILVFSVSPLSYPHVPNR